VDHDEGAAEAPMRAGVASLQRLTVEWSDLQIFLAVVRAKTVRAAAAAMKLDASTVSRRVAALERTAGVRLFRRTTAGLRLTAAGKIVLDSTERVSDELDRLTRRMIGHDERLAGLVRVSFPGSFTSLVHQPRSPRDLALRSQSSPP
jgi:DNA-binding transcriptional LysR family regulator